MKLSYKLIIALSLLAIMMAYATNNHNEKINSSFLIPQCSENIAEICAKPRGDIFMRKVKKKLKVYLA